MANFYKRLPLRAIFALYRNQLHSLTNYAVVIAKAKTDQKEVEYGLEHDKHYNRKYSTQQLMIFIPFTIVVLAVKQELNRQNKSQALIV